MKKAKLVDLPVNTASDAIDADRFFLETSIVILKAPSDAAVWVLFAVLPQNLRDWLLWFVIVMVWLLVWPLLVEVLSSRSRCLGCGNVSLLWSLTRSFDVESLCI